MTGNIRPTAAQLAAQQAANRRRQIQEQGGTYTPDGQPTYGIGAGEHWMPPPIESVRDTGLNALYVQELLLKILYFSNFLTGYQLAEQAKLPFTGVVQPLLEGLRKERAVEVKGQGGFGDGAYQYAITDLGTGKARESLERSQYAGPCPVPLPFYVASVNEQNYKVMVNPDMMTDALRHLVISPSVFDKVGPAVNSGRSIFLYGPPGNGKTTISEAVGRVVLGQAMYIPYAIDIGGQVVRVFDNVNHEAIEEDEDYQGTGSGRVRRDPRWVKIKRPVIIVGGELTLETLDLVYDPINKFYEAPYQVKANGGMFLIDDFGRQQVAPRELLNRWIVPLEKRVDYLTMANGRKLEVPFNVLVVFSTNIEPRDLVDEAFLRRIRHKIEIIDPTFEEFREIFRRVARARGLPYTEEGDKVLAYLLQKWYVQANRDLRAVHPRDIIDQMKDIASYLGVPFQMTPELIDRACEAYFVEL